MTEKPALHPPDKINITKEQPGQGSQAMSEVKQLTIPAPMPVIVVIDDEEIVGMVINLSLRRRGYTTIFFNSANEAIAHIADQSIQVDAVITDYSMP